MGKIKFLSLFFILVQLGCANENSGIDQGNKYVDDQQQIIDGAPIHDRQTKAARSVVVLELIRYGGNTEVSCTGTLIGKNTILTAAHCFDEKLVGKAVLGFNVIFSEKYDKGKHPAEIVRKVLNKKSHEKYNTLAKKGKPLLYDHDVAVVYFQGEAPKEYNPVNLDSNVDADYSNLQIYVYGYGRYLDNTGVKGDSGRSAGQLRRGLMLIDDNYPKHQDRYFTAAVSSTKLCQGDSGGPQFYHENGVLKQIGVNSAAWGEALANGQRSCARFSQATKVSYFYNWIRQTQQELQGAIQQ